MSQQRFRFVVSSAEEAITVLRERIGDHARVVSVRQVEGTGLAKFLQAPKLEVIAELIEPDANAPELASLAPPGTASASPDALLPATSTAATPINPGPAIGAATPPPSAAESLSGTPPSAPPSNNANGSAPMSAASSQTSPAAPASADPSSSTLSRLLRAGGLPPQVLARLQSDSGWADLERLPTGRALQEVGINLRREYHSTAARPLGDRVAFLGSPGAGKTTALCKWLACDVFVRQRRGVVLKLDLDRANPSDALAIFCEALGVPCARSIPDVPSLEADQTLYIDVPGILPGHDEDVLQIEDALGPLFTTSRVIVINAAYDAALIKRAYEFAERAGCTHAVFTHLDELTHWGKLWEFLIAQKLTPLFLSTGPNIAGDLDENIFDAVLARTFPAVGAQVARDGITV